MPDDARSVAVLLEVRHGLMCMSLRVAQNNDSGSIVLEKMHDDAVSNAATCAGNYIDLYRILWVSCLGETCSDRQKGKTSKEKESLTLPVRSGMSLSGSKLSPRKKPEVTIS